MKKTLFFCAILWLTVSGLSAQNSLPWLNMHSSDMPNTIGSALTYRHTLHVGLSYTRVMACKGIKLAIISELSAPAVLIARRDKDVHLSLALPLTGGKWDAPIRGGFSYKRFEDVLSTGNALFYHAGIHPGYFGKRFYLSGEFSLRSNLFTALHFTERYPGHADLTLKNTSGYFTAGVNTGWRFSQKAGMDLRILYETPRRGAAYEPFTTHIVATLGGTYRF